MEAYWVPGVNNLGRWALGFTGVQTYYLEEEFNEKVKASLIK